MFSPLSFLPMDLRSFDCVRRDYSPLRSPSGLASEAAPRARPNEAIIPTSARATIPLYAGLLHDAVLSIISCVAVCWLHWPSANLCDSKWRLFSRACKCLDAWGCFPAFGYGPVP